MNIRNTNLHFSSVYAEREALLVSLFEVIDIDEDRARDIAKMALDKVVTTPNIHVDELLKYLKDSFEKMGYRYPKDESDVDAVRGNPLMLLENYAFSSEILSILLSKESNGIVDEIYTKLSAMQNEAANSFRSRLIELSELECIDREE